MKRKTINRWTITFTKDAASAPLLKHRQLYSFLSFAFILICYSFVGISCSTRCDHDLKGHAESHELVVAPEEYQQIVSQLMSEIDTIEKSIDGSESEDDLLVTRADELVKVLSTPLALALAERAMRTLREQPNSENGLRDLNLSCRLQPGNFFRHYWLANFLRSHFEDEKFIKLREALFHADMAVQNVSYGNPSVDVLQERKISAYALRARIKLELGGPQLAEEDQKAAFDAAIVPMATPYDTTPKQAPFCR